jgi:hypothetical protein
MADQIRVVIEGDDGATAWFPLPREHVGLVPGMLQFADEAMAKLRKAK